MGQQLQDGENLQYSYKAVLGWEMKLSIFDQVLPFPTRLGFELLKKTFPKKIFS